MALLHVLPPFTVEIDWTSRTIIGGSNETWGTRAVVRVVAGERRSRTGRACDLRSFVWAVISFSARMTGEHGGVFRHQEACLTLARGDAGACRR